MKLIEISEITEKKSKFLGYFFELDTVEETNKALSLVKEDNPKARHVCLGAVFDSEKIFKNDSEVGNPGKILLNILEKRNLKNHALIVARYFGGIKLGPSGVGKAFRNVAKLLIK